MPVSSPADAVTPAPKPSIPTAANEAATGGGTVPVESVRRALRVLGHFGPEREVLGVTALASALGLHKSTVHRLLLTLEQEGFVRRVDTGQYALTWRLLEIAAAIPVRNEVRDLSLRHLSSLAEKTGESAHLAILFGDEVLYIEKVESPRALRMPSRVGVRVPLHCTALGKVLLAGQSEADVRRILFSAPLAALGPRTVTDPVELLSRIDKVKLQGYAIDYEEIEEGLMCIAAPIRDAGDGEYVAAISIAGPLSRVDTRIEQHVAVLRETAAALSLDLGPLARHIG